MNVSSCALSADLDLSVRAAQPSRLARHWTFQRARKTLSGDVS